MFSRNRAVAVLAALLLVQILDCKSLYAEVHQVVNSKPRPGVQLKDPFWRQIGNRFDTLVILPAFQTQFRFRTYDAPAGDDHWRIFGMLAAKQKMAINSAYLARHEPKQLEHHLETQPSLISSGQLDERTLYVVSPRFLVRLLENQAKGVFCQTVDGVAVCWKAPPGSEDNLHSIWSALEQAGYSVSLLDRFAYHPHEVAMDLRKGFRLPEGEIFLTDGHQTRIPLLLDKARPVRRIQVDLTPLNFPDKSSRQFNVWIGPYQAGTWNLTGRSSVTVEIPDQAWTEGSFTRRIVPLVFQWEGQASSGTAGDAQPAAAGFHELWLEY